MAEPDTPDQAQAAVEAAASAWKKITDERNSLRVKLERALATTSQLETRLKDFESRSHQLEAELGFYMRFATELVTHINDCQKIFEEAIIKARQGAYRPNNSAPRNLDDPIPRFLTVDDKGKLASLEKEISSSTDKAPF